MPVPREDARTGDHLSSALAVRGLGKRFNRQVALESVDLTIARGEIHGLVGENGSGKSTLIKVLAGLYPPSSGELYVGGKHVAFPSHPGELTAHAMAFVHQDLALVGDLSVADNLAISDIASRRSPWRLSRRGLERAARVKLDEFAVDIDPSAPVSGLAAVDKAKLAIVRALVSIGSSDAAAKQVRVLVLDEPTVFLPRREVDRLFALVHHAAQEGASILFVSHDLDEVWANCDTITVLRDGRVAGRRRVESTTVAEMVETIVGRSVTSAATENGSLGDLSHAASSVPAVVEASSVSGATITDVDVTIAKGEILGVTGLAGSGYDELPYLLYGASRNGVGALRLAGTLVSLQALTPRQALQMGMVLVPGDRRRLGIVGNLSVTDNLTLPHLRALSRKGLLGRRIMARETRSLMERFDIRPRDPVLDLGLLSGGNQQKGVLAKWLSTTPTVVLLDEPTQGVDIGAREQIFAALRTTAAGGAAVLCASSDYSQLAELCHRVLVLRDGTIAAELAGRSLTKSHISEACLSSGSLVRSAAPTS